MLGYRLGILVSRVIEPDVGRVCQASAMLRGQVMDDSLVLFYYTLAILLASVLTAAACLASYLVARARPMLYACLAFLFYFFDVAIVFQDDFLATRVVSDDGPFFIGSPVATIVTGCGCLVSFWLMVCEYAGVKSRAAKWAPGVAFAAASAAVLAAFPQGSAEMFAFYSLRAAFVYAVLGFAWFRSVSAGAEVKVRLGRFRRWGVAIALLTTATVAENAAVLLVPGVLDAWVGPSFFPERNFAENMLVIACAFVACRAAWRMLSARHENPPMKGERAAEELIAEGLPAYALANGLSARETEIAKLVLSGMDNQNIASKLHLSPGTVKVHVHHVLQKTGAPNRKELAKDFWSFG